MPSGEAHERAIALFHEALELPREEWSAWLSSRTGDDPGLHADVWSLLQAHEQVGGVLDRPAEPLTGELLLANLRDALGDRYDIRGEVGRGGMALVFLAHERKHDRRVALKVMRPEIAAVYGRERFEQEVRVAAQLNHPHILGLIDSGEVDGLLYYVMPFIDGETLRERLDREGPWTGVRALRLLRQIAEALDHAHARGVIHRDLKPGNVLCAGDHPYIMDFGVAKTVPQAGNGNPDLTRPGVALGTPRYMAPEQALGGVPVDHRADLYAWGVLACELLTGLRSTATGIGFEVRGLEAAAAGGGISPVLVEAVRRCLRPNPEDRYESAAALVTALDRDPSSMDRESKVPVRTWVGLAALLAGVTAASIWAMRPSEEAVAGVPISTPLAVAPFSNETGSPELDAVGRMAGDWIAQGLQQLGTVPVLPWPAALEAAERGKAEAGGFRQDLANYLSQELGAGTVITGSIYQIGEDVQLGAVVTDVTRGRIVSAPEPILTSQGQIHEAIRLLRNRIMGSLAFSTDERFVDGPALSTAPPTFASYRDFNRGIDRFLSQDYAEASELFHSAWTKDTTFLVSRVYEARALFNQSQYDAADETLDFIEARDGRLSEYAALEVEFIRAARAGDGARALELSEAAAALGPNSRAGWNHAAMAVQLNRPREAIRTLLAIDPDRGAMRGWAQYWTQLAHASHLLRDYAGEEGYAREMWRRYPERRVATVLIARSLAAAGGGERLQAALDEFRILPPLTYWSYGAAVTTAGLELVHHGHPAEGNRMLEHAVEWFRTELTVAPGDRGFRYWLAMAQYGLQQWDEAVVTLEALAADFPERGNYQDFHALAVARTTGDRQAALRVADDPAAGHQRGDHLAYRARLESILGAPDRAISLLSEAMQRGVDDFSWLHARAHHDLLPLHEVADFQRLMTPGDP
ncbi:MAG: protein kinase [Gemmatimonadota bacterium]|nr:protein kinase [Gemmatimonadota bacterium]